LKDGGLLPREEMQPHSIGMKKAEKQVSEQQKKAVV
jgi:hypothetical protein